MNACVIEKHNDLIKVNRGSFLFFRGEIKEENNLIKLGSINYEAKLFNLYVKEVNYDENYEFLSINEIKIRIKDALDYVIFNKYLELFDNQGNNLDLLTNLYNQNAYIKYKNRLNYDKKENIYIFTIDANGLKITNDTMGHLAGDELLQGCAKVILKVFKDKEICFRRGGDEFSIILNGNNIEPLTYYEEIKKEAKLFKGEYIKDMTLSVGYSSNIETGTYDIEEIEKAADASMYADKEKFYNKTFKSFKYEPGSDNGKLYKLIHDTFEMIPAGICLVDIKENYSYYRFNTPFMKFFGYEKAEEFSNISFKDLLKSYDIELDKYDKNKRSSEYMIRGHRLKISFNDDREYGETLYVALYI